jgi:pseudouridylate synthase
VSAGVRFSEEISDARAAGRAIVALETSVLAQGLPAPRNIEAAASIEAGVRSAGAMAAWVWIGDGDVRVGFEPGELERVASGDPPAFKVARRDLPMAVVSGVTGATTVSATLWAAHHAGIEVMATGGIGGIHPGSGDVSADLLEMARTPGTVVCSGPKSIVDPAATLERLEELGVGVIGYRCDRLPFFLVADSGLPLEHRAEDPGQVASASRARAELGVASALLVCNPIPTGAAMDRADVDAAVGHCLALAESSHITGKDVTPFLLSCLAERTKGRSLEANLALLRSNAELAGQVAAALV